jgi:hypothetical protein
LNGDVAQLGEYHNGIVGVEGSSPFISTKEKPIGKPLLANLWVFFISLKENDEKTA